MMNKNFKNKQKIEILLIKFKIKKIMILIYYL